MEFRKPTADERRLLLHLAKIAQVSDPEIWVDTLKVRAINDGGMGSLELGSAGQLSIRSTPIVPKASVQFTDEDGVEVVATLNASEDGVPFELDIWKTDFSPLRRISTHFHRLEE